MKKINIIVLMLFGTLIHLSSTDQNIYFDDNEIKISINQLNKLEDTISFYYNDNVKYEIIDIDTIYFNDSTGYYLTIENNENIVKSTLIKGNFKNFEVIAMYESDIFKDVDNTPYYVSAFELSENPVKAEVTKNLKKETNTASTNSTYSFFEIDNYQSNLYMYGASYMSEVYIKNVPNYMNTMYNHNGCVPTTCAMHFAYLEDNGYPDITGYRNLPINHTDNLILVNNYIKYLGDTSFLQH